LSIKSNFFFILFLTAVNTVSATSPLIRTIRMKIVHAVMAICARIFPEDYFTIVPNSIRV